MIAHERRPEFGAILRDQWGDPTVSELPDPLGAQGAFVFQNADLEENGVAWRFTRTEQGWSFVGGAPWSTHSAVAVAMNEASLASAISVDRMSALERFIAPATGSYMASYQLTTFQDTSGSWIAGHVALADVDTETALLSDTISSAGSTHDVRVNVARTAAIDLEAGQEIGLFMYRDTQIWSIRSFGFQITPIRLDLA